MQFRQLATDYTLWMGGVVIRAANNPRKAEFVVQECLNSGTREFSVYGRPRPPYVSPRYAGYPNPTTRFPNLKLSFVGSHSIEWIDGSNSDGEKEAKISTTRFVCDVCCTSEATVRCPLREAVSIRTTLYIHLGAQFSKGVLIWSACLPRLRRPLSPPLQDPEKIDVQEELARSEGLTPPCSENSP